MISLAFVIAVALVIALLIFLAQMLRPVPGGEANSRRTVWWRRLRIFIVLLLLAVALCGIWATLIEPNRLIVRHETLRIATWPKELNGLRIAVIGDIHTGAPFIDDRKLGRVVELINQENPDLIVLLGDYMSPNSWHSHLVAPGVTAGILKDLRAPLGTYAVLGNHDWWYGGEKVRAALEANGIHVLEEEVAEVRFRNSSFWLLGFADLWTRPQHIQETLMKTPDAARTIALSHNPDMFIHTQATMPLMLAAHTHGGQVKLPILGAPIVPSYFGPRYTAGDIIEQGHHLFITTGIGTSILPVRFRVPPEIVILTIQP
ncbi:MAG TPA: metallophosphoesterase [Pyrinomonadaceae bacterium]|nr:metallophosphoesterase [Pyrinomonadaceae bacterium]